MEIWVKVYRQDRKQKCGGQEQDWAHESAQQWVIRKSQASDRTLDLNLEFSEKFSEGRVWDLMYLSSN